MKTQPIGQSSLVSTRLVYGNMRTLQTWFPNEVTPERVDKAIQSHIAAYEAGYLHFDTADIYCRGQCEVALGKTLKQVSGMREKIIVATKCGIRFPNEPTEGLPQRFDFSEKHIVWSCENSLKNLQIDTIDLFYLHRPDALMVPAEVAKAFEKLKKSGKVREFAVSNFSPGALTLLQKALPMKLVGNQIKFHPAWQDPLTNGMLEQCYDTGMSPLGYSPMAAGWLGTGATIDPESKDFEKHKKIQEAVDGVAAEMGVSRSVAALAWMMRHPSKILPIIGSNNPDHIREAAKADDVEMTREQWYKITVAGQG